MKLYILLIIIALLQWLVMQLPNINPTFDSTVFLYGNLQMIIVVGMLKSVEYLRKK